MIQMADSIVPEDLPATYGNYLVYTDGDWPTAARVRELHPSARLLTMTVKGGQADGCDCETGDLTPAQAAAWAKRRLAAGQWRPVVYANASTMAGSSGVLAELAAAGVARQLVRLLSAHYGKGNHVCGPGTCKATPVDMDGTQWTDTAAGVGGTVIDLSTLNDDFFGAPAPVIPVEADVKLTQLQNGSTGQPVQNWQGLLVAHGLGFEISTGRGNVMEWAGVDGAFGARTVAATKAFQAEAGLPQTGVVDAATWQRALG